MAKVLVTGAQGCIGSWVVKQLLERGDDVVIYDLGPGAGPDTEDDFPDLVEKLKIEPGKMKTRRR